MALSFLANLGGAACIVLAAAVERELSLDAEQGYTKDRYFGRFVMAMLVVLAAILLTMS